MLVEAVFLEDRQEQQEDHPGDHQRLHRALQGQVVVVIGVLVHRRRHRLADRPCCQVKGGGGGVVSFVSFVVMGVGWLQEGQ